MKNSSFHKIDIPTYLWIDQLMAFNPNLLYSYVYHKSAFKKHSCFAHIKYKNVH